MKELLKPTIQKIVLSLILICIFLITYLIFINLYTIHCGIIIPRSSFTYEQGPVAVVECPYDPVLDFFYLLAYGEEKFKSTSVFPLISVLFIFVRIFLFCSLFYIFSCICITIYKKWIAKKVTRKKMQKFREKK